MDKSSSISSRNVCTPSPKQRNKDLEAFSGQQRKGEKEAPLLDLPRVLEDVDRFLHSTTPTEEVPDCVHVLTKILASMIDRYNAGRSKLGHQAEEDSSFLDAVGRISMLCATLSAFPCVSALDKASSVLEEAMFFLEKHLCALLQDPKSCTSTSNNYFYDFQSKTKTPKKSSSFSSLIQVQDSDLCAACAVLNNEFLNPATAGVYHQDQDQNEDFPEFSQEKVSILNKIATTMVAAGYQTECCLAFASFRRCAFKAVLQSFGYGNLSMEEVHRMQWELLEGEIATWNKVVRHCTTVLFNAERRLYDSVFPDQRSISQSLFSHVERAVIIHFLNFAQGVVLKKLSAEKLFKILDMYETLRDVELGIADDSYPDQRCAQELAHEAATAKIRIAEAAVGMIYGFQNSVKGDNERIPVPNGAIHPLTRYVMNYLEYACEYKDTLEQVLQQCLHVDRKPNSSPSQADTDKMELDDNDGTPKNSPFAVQLMTIMDLLNANVESKSKLYRDPALRYVFLMNNGRYIAQKIKGCANFRESMGDNWCRRRQSRLRLYHKSYQRETWSKVLQCLNPEGLQVQGSGNKVSKQLLKERFKCFNGIFEEIHKTQSTWVVSDEQLKFELRASISALVIPAYRSFLGRFKHHLQPSRHIDKYIKHHPEDIETLIDDLFDGGSTSITRRSLPFLD